MDFAQLGIPLDPDQVGHPEFDPRAMLKLLVYGYSYGIRSSRKLERATHHNLSFIWLLGGLRPDHKTIARFRRDHRGALKEVLRHCAYLCLKLGLIDGNTLFVDGTKVGANASHKNTWTPKRCASALAEIDQRIETILEECDQADQVEEDQPSLVTLRQALQEQQQLRAQVQTTLDELTTQNKTGVNTTDPECGRMRTGPHVEPGYNWQLVVDDKYGLLVHTDVVSASNDVNQLRPQLQHAHDVTGKTCGTACADAGYSNPEEAQTLLDQGVDVIVPVVRHSQFRDHFTYSAETDLYQCPEGHHLKYIGNHIGRDHTRARVYAITNPVLCRECPQFGTCTTSSQGRRLERPFSEAIRERLEQRYQQPDAQAIARRRQCRSEHPFGHLKHNLGMRSFLLRGLAGVRAEAALAATAFNLTRMIKVAGVHALVRP